MAEDSSSPPLVLASASPQRRAILERVGVRFTVRPANIEEIQRGEPAEVVVANALSKARAARLHAGETVLGCDTLVALERRIYGKPADIAQARATLRALSGATHTVFSGLALLRGERERVAFARTEVSIRELDDELVEWYLAKGEWRGRAGGYAIQGAGSAIVREIRGDYENVVGLPLAALIDLFPELL
ncbi:MAG TPA: Maf family protein [Solirubrobacteraceae bacterium]